MGAVGAVRPRPEVAFQVDPPSDDSLEVSNRGDLQRLVLQIFSTAERFERLRGLLPQLDALVILAAVLVLCGAAKEL